MQQIQKPLTSTIASKTRRKTKQRNIKNTSFHVSLYKKNATGAKTGRTEKKTELRILLSEKLHFLQDEGSYFLNPRGRKTSTVYKIKAR